MADILFDLQRRLHGVRRKERLVTWVAGASRLCLWLLLLLSFFFVVDIWIVRSLDTLEGYVVRGLLTAVVLGLLAWRGYEALYRPLGAGLDDDLMALRVENAHPELRHRLISTLQLTRAASEERLVGSTELVAALEEETLSFTRAITFPEVVRFKPAWDWFWKALLCLVLAAGLCTAFPRHASAFFLRLMFLERDYPTRVTLEKIVCVNSVGAVVLDEDSLAAPGAGTAISAAATNPPLAAGDKVEIRVYPTADAQLPLADDERFADGVLIYQYTEGPNQGVDHELTLAVPKDLAKSAAELIRAGKGPASGAAEWAAFRTGLYWKATLDAVTDSFRATAELDDGRIAWKRFQVLPRPVVRAIKVTVIAPSYTPLDPEVHDKTGDVAAIQGSVVKIELQATQKLLHAQLQFSDPDPVQPPASPVPAAPVGLKPQVIKLKADDTTKSETTWRGSFEVNRNTSYSIDLRATNGLANPANPPVYQVVCKIDPLPTIHVKFPKGDDTVTLNAKYPVQFAAHDNFGLKALRLRYKIGDEENEKISTLDISPNLNGPLDFEGTFPLVLRTLAGSNGPAGEGDVVTFWLEARDAATTDRPVGMTPGLAESAYTKNWARSNLYRLAIVTAAEKENELRLKVQEQLELIQQQADTIKKDRNERVVPAIENKPAP